MNLEEQVRRAMVGWSRTELYEGYAWSGDAAATSKLRSKLKKGMEAAKKALPENAGSAKRSKALKRYIAATGVALEALMEVRLAQGDIEDAV